MLFILCYITSYICFVRIIRLLNNDKSQVFPKFLQPFSAPDPLMTPDAFVLFIRHQHNFY